MIERLKKKLADAIDAQKMLIAAAEKDGRDFTDDEVASFEEHQKTVDATSRQIQAIEKAAGNTAVTKAAAKAAKADATGNIARATEDDGGDAIECETISGGTRNLSGAELVGVCAWAAAKNKLFPTKTALQHLDDAGFGRIADMSRKTSATLARNKTMLSTTVSGGDNTIVTPLSTDFIEFLRNSSAFLAGQPRQIDLSFGKLDIPGGATGATGSYTAEGADAGYTQATTRKVSLSAKHLSAVTAIGNFYLEVTPLAMAQFLGDDLAAGLTLAIDSAGLRGDGTGNNPAGLLTLVNAAHKFAASANVIAPTFAQIEADLRNAETKILTSNIPRLRWRCMMAGRTFVYMKYLRDANGNYIYPSLHETTPMLMNMPVTLTEQIPSTLGVGTNESEIHFADFGHVLMGVARALTLKSSTEASYKDSGGNMQSAFSRDETVIRGSASHDFDMRHDKAAVVITGVKWGAAA